MKTDELVLSAAEGRLVRVLRVLANPARCRIVTLPADRKECAAGQLAQSLPLAQSTLSEHLTALREAELVQTSGEGAARTYRLDPAALDFLATYLSPVSDSDCTHGRSWCCRPLRRAE